MKKNDKILWLAFILMATLFIGVGYAVVNPTTLFINGYGSVAANGVVYIENVVLLEKSNDLTAEIIEVTDTNFSFEATLNMGEGHSSGSQERYVIYNVTVHNDSIFAYKFGNEVFAPSISTYAPHNATLTHSYEIIGLDQGETILAKTRKTFQVKISMSPTQYEGNHIVAVNAIIDVEEEDNGMVIGSLTGTTTGDLTGTNLNKLAHFTASVLNSYNSNQTFTLSIKNDNFSIVNSSGNALGSMVVNGNSEGTTFDFYIKKNTTNPFPSTPQRINVYLTLAGETIDTSIGIVSLTVDKDVSLTDYSAPTIESLTVTKVNDKRQLDVEWRATDDVGIESYTVELYNSSNTLISSKTDLTKETTSCSFTHDKTTMPDGSYYVKLIAYDTIHSSNRSTNPESHSWTYSVSITCNNCTASPSSGNVEAGDSFTSSLSDSYGSYSAGTVTMGGQSTSDYSLSGSTFKINKVTGDVQATINGTSCLIKGTKVLLANGTTKNVEDIYYNDLLLVYSHEIGEFVPEYPIWVESEKHTDRYQLHTFSDDTTLKTLGRHTVFSVDDNEFVDVSDPEKYHIGTKILKVEKVNGKYKFKEVTVTKIKTIYENTTYYDIVSTRYYNAITDNVLTSDGRPELPNFYLFKENVLWSDRRQEVLENNIQAPYEMVSYMPYYLYMGLRAMDGAVLVHYGYMTYNDFSELFHTLLMNPKMQLPPQTNKKGNRVWMATTSLDNVTELNKNNFLVEEGSYYTLPCRFDIKKWYSPSNNEYYNCNDKVQIWHGMHFIGITKD